MTLGERFGWRGREVAWTRFGDGPPVVFCHGTPFSSIVWRPYAEALARDFTVHLWDMPGYGASSKQPGHAVDFDVHGQLLADLIGHWGLDRPDVVAHDFGGAVALRGHLIQGVPYRSLLLVDVVALPPTGSPFFRFVKEHPGVLDGLPAYIHEALVTAYIQGASHRGLRPGDLDALKAPWLTEEGQGAFYRQIAQTDERYLAEIEERLPALDLPVRVLWGADDEWIPPATGERLAGLIPGAAFGLIPGAGHLVQYDAPAALGTELRAWLARA